MPAVAVPPAPPVFSPVRVSARIEELDILRGFLLLWMTLTHLPTHVSVYSNQVIGYVSAAEGFIFMAALLTGQIHRGQTGKYGAATASRNVFRRAWRIYRFHAALLVIAFTLGAWVAIH